MDLLPQCPEVKGFVPEGVILEFLVVQTWISRRSCSLTT